MDTRILFSLILGVVVLERLVELILSTRNARRVLARGGVEVGSGHYRWMVAVHSLFLVSCLVEVWWLQPPFVPPLALGMGEGSEVRAPMAVAVIGGLTVSTLLTLVIIPVIYTYTDAFAERVKNRMAWIVHREKRTVTPNRETDAGDAK